MIDAYNRGKINVGDTVYCVGPNFTEPVPMKIFAIQELPDCNGVNYCITLQDKNGNIHSPDCEKLEVFKDFDAAIKAVKNEQKTDVKVDYLIEIGTTNNSYPKVNCFAPAIVMSTNSSILPICPPISSLDEAREKFNEVMGDFDNVIKSESAASKAAWASEGIYDVDDFNAIFLVERTAVNSNASLRLIAVYSEI